MILPSTINILKIATGNYGKIASYFHRFDGIAHVNLVDIESINISSLQNDSLVVIPGVGSFEQTISHIDSCSKRNDLTYIINSSSYRKLCICLGMQILFETSHEYVQSPPDGLSIYKGIVTSFDIETSRYKFNTGFRNIEFSNIPNLMSSHFYFNHGYYLDRDSTVINNSEVSNYSYSSNGSTNILSSFFDPSRNLLATQFHPEMSAPQHLLTYLAAVN